MGGLSPPGRLPKGMASAPKWRLGNGALAKALVKALYDAKHEEEYHLRMVALLRTMEADRLVALAAKARGRPTHNLSSMNSENARTRRSRTRAAGRASAQAAKDSAAEAKARAEQEAAAGVAAGVEEALAEVRRKEEIKELPQREEEAAEEAANDVQDSGDMKEAGDMDEEEQEPKEDEGAEEEPTLALALGKRTKALGAPVQALTQGIKVGAKLAADDHDQGSEDTKEAGETGDEEQKAEEKDGEGKGQAALTTTAENDGGGGARSFSSPPVDRTHHSPRGKRRMSGEKEREEETRQMRLELERVQEQYDSSEPKGVWTGTKEEWTEVYRLRREEMTRLHALRRRYRERDPKDYQQFEDRKKRERLRKGLGLAKGDG